MSTMIDKINNTHPLSYAASGQGLKPNMLSHDQAMKAVDSDKFELLMAKDIENMWDSEHGLYD